MRYALLRLSACAALVIALQPAPARADTWDRLTYFTFSGPVQLPGITLAAGTYEFRLVNPQTSSRSMHPVVGEISAAKVHALKIGSCE